jgi:hypothetical protein
MFGNFSKSLQSCGTGGIGSEIRHVAAFTRFLVCAYRLQHNDHNAARKCKTRQNAHGSFGRLRRHCVYNTCGI